MQTARAAALDDADDVSRMNEKELHTQFAELFFEIKRLEADLKDKKRELETMSNSLVEEFISKEIEKISIKGGLTLRLDCKIWPKVKSAAEAVAAIRGAGLTELLAKENYQTQSLAAFLRECAENDEPLPKEFEGIIEPNPVYKIIATRH